MCTFSAACDAWVGLDTSLQSIPDVPKAASTLLLDSNVASVWAAFTDTIVTCTLRWACCFLMTWKDERKLHGWEEAECLATTDGSQVDIKHPRSLLSYIIIISLFRIHCSTEASLSGLQFFFFFFISQLYLLLVSFLTWSHSLVLCLLRLHFPSLDINHVATMDHRLSALCIYMTCPTFFVTLACSCPSINATPAISSSMARCTAFSSFSDCYKWPHRHVKQAYSSSTRRGLSQ